MTFKPFAGSALESPNPPSAMNPNESPKRNFTRFVPMAFEQRVMSARGISKRNSCLALLEGSNKASLRHFQQPRIALPPIRGFRPRDCALDGFAGIGKRNGKLPDQFVFAHLNRTDLVEG